jgi:RNA polymerase sigma-70 factor (ECF subfamily)
MDQDPHACGRDLEGYRAYLSLLARNRVDPRLWCKIDPEDLVQMSFEAAHQAKDQLQGQSEAELKVWLRQILLHKLANVLRDLRRAKRDIAQERSLEDAIEQSSSRLNAWLAAQQSSPSERAERNEQQLRLDEAVATLPDAQREVVVLRYFHAWSLADIARHINRSQSAVAGLLHRGMEQLRTLLQEPQ